jgi:rubrerythrin
MLKDQLDREEHETEVYAGRVRVTENSVVRLFYAKLMRDSMQHADVLNSAIGHLATDQWETLAPPKETREEILRLMEIEEKALRLFTSTSAQVSDTHLRSLLAMLAIDEEQHYAILKYILENFVEKNQVIRARV